MSDLPEKIKRERMQKELMKLDNTILQGENELLREQISLLERKGRIADFFVEIMSREKIMTKIENEKADELKQINKELDALKGE
jgi:hypothetical protein